MPDDVALGSRGRGPVTHRSLVGVPTYTRLPMTKDSFQIRLASVADVADLAELRYQWRSREGGERGLDESSFESALSAWMEDRRATHVPFLALNDGRPIGMAWLALVDRVPGPEHFIRRSAYVQSVYVVAGMRSKGIGTALMTVLLDHARTLDLDYVAVHPTERSFTLYRRLGFSDTNRVLELRSLDSDARAHGADLLFESDQSG